MQILNANAVYRQTEQKMTAKTHQMKTKHIIVVAFTAITIALISNFNLNGKAIAKASLATKTNVSDTEMSGWSEASKMGVRDMKKQYGDPKAATEDMMKAKKMNEMIEKEKGNK